METKTGKFFRKAVNLGDVKALSTWEGIPSDRYVVVREIKVNRHRWRAITNNLLNPIPELANAPQGGVVKGIVQAIKFINGETGEYFLSNPEGHSYSRYTSL